LLEQQELEMSIRNNVNQLVEMVQQGQILEAFDRFYAEGVSMLENTNPPTQGKGENRLREEQFLATVKEVHENRAAFSVVEENRAVIGWVLEFTNTEGTRLRLDQVAVQEWAGGQIVSERFVYDTASVVVKDLVLA